MKDIDFLLVVTKDDQTTLLSFLSNEMNALKFKHDYFLKHGYEVHVYKVTSLPYPNILLTSFILNF